MRSQTLSSLALCYLNILSFHHHDCKMVRSSRHPIRTQDRKSGEGLAPARAVQFIREAKHGRSSLAVFLFVQVWATSHSYKGELKIECLTMETEAIMYQC